MTDDASKAALHVEDLTVDFVVRGIPRRVLRGVSFSVRPGESYGLVGESGCGKSTTAYAALGLLADNGRVVGGRALIAGQDVTHMPAAALRDVRKRDVSMVYQDPGAALNPTLRIGTQVTEAFTVLGGGKAEARDRAFEALRRVRISDPRGVLDRYPHQLSGGMQQRVVIAMALANDPKLLVLDEPTTGLDATVEAEVLDLVESLRADTGAAVLLIAHNLGVIRRICDRVGVMYAGQVVEQGPAGAVFDAPSHPYTVGLLRCLPRHGARKGDRRLETIPGFLPQIGEDLPACVFVDRCPIATDLCRTTPPPLVPVGTGYSRCHHIDRIGEIVPSGAVGDGDAIREAVEPILRLSDVNVTFRQNRKEIHALVGIDLDLRPGETLGLVGESGSGKTTLAKAILGIQPADPGGQVILDGVTLAGSTRQRPQEARRSIQIVFQNPDSALNRAQSVRAILGRALAKLAGITGDEADRRLDTLITHVRLTPRHLDLKPRQLSGGLKQRVAIGRAFAGDPRIVVCDEPTSALDVSVQAAILNLLADLQRDENSSYVFISHDLGVVRYLSDRIAVLYLGRIMEFGTAAQVFAGPHHPYTEALLSAVPSVDGAPEARIRLDGEVPSAADPPSGCVFHTRCPRKIEGLCEVTVPPLVEVEAGHRMACHIPVEELRRLQSADPVPVAAGRPAQRENQSVRKAAALLRAAAGSGAGTTVSALARAAELPRATALRMIESLVAERLLARLPDDRVVIGPGLHSLARTTDLTELLLDAARAPMEQLAARVKESVTLTVGLPDGSLALVRQVDGPHMLGVTNWVGRPFALHTSSSGKLALAFADEARVEALLRIPLAKVASRTITDAAQFRAELARVRAAGWSQIEDEIEDGLAAISAGIFFDGSLVGSLNITGPTTRFGARARRAALPSLRRACAAVEANLGSTRSRARPRRR
jgi:peptide/nickel transport system ATP-binding protein